ncbi:MAG TPA: serine hydrolase [Cyclobacteriaceae bacterium]|nr:serine hydrolase [Cyclobacteriaceae bacterium]
MIHRRHFIKQLGFSAAGIGLITSLPASVDAFPYYAKSLPRSIPETEGVSSAGLISFLDAIEKSNIEFHSLMVLRHGKVIAEGWWAPYAAPLKHTLYSLSKSFTSTAVGLAIHEGKFTLDSKVISFFPDELPAEVSDNLSAMTVKDLLTMSTGHGKDTIQPMRGNTTGESWAKVFLSLPVEYKPGTHFLYNTGSTYMQSAIVQKTTGKSVLEYLKPRLFEPLGIEGMDWEADPKGISTGGYGLRVRTEDIAKFGQLFLQKGLWNGKQLVPAKWIEQATSAQVDNAPANPSRSNAENDWAQGYGFQFWRCTHNAVRGDGAFGQFCMMMPDQDVVVAITGESFDLQGSMKLVWDHVIPAVTTSAPKDQQAQTNLLAKLKSLALPVPNDKPSSPIASTVSGKKFTLSENALNVKTISFNFKGSDCIVDLTGDTNNDSFTCGMNRWVVAKQIKTQGIFAIQGRQPVTTPLAAAATWSDENTLVITLRYVEVAHSDKFVVNFNKNEITMSFLNSVSKGNPSVAEQRPTLTGKLTA